MERAVLRFFLILMACCELGMRRGAHVLWNWFPFIVVPNQPPRARGVYPHLNLYIACVISLSSPDRAAERQDKATIPPVQDTHHIPLFIGHGGIPPLQNSCPALPRLHAARVEVAPTSIHLFEWSRASISLDRTPMGHSIWDLGLARCELSRALPAPNRPPEYTRGRIKSPARRFLYGFSRAYSCLPLLFYGCSYDGPCICEFPAEARMGVAGSLHGPARFNVRVLLSSAEACSTLRPPRDLSHSPSAPANASFPPRFPPPFAVSTPRSPHPSKTPPAAQALLLCASPIPTMPPPPVHARSIPAPFALRCVYFPAHDHSAPRVFLPSPDAAHPHTSPDVLLPPPATVYASPCRPHTPACKAPGNASPGHSVSHCGARTARAPRSAASLTSALLPSPSRLSVLLVAAHRLRAPAQFYQTGHLSGVRCATPGMRGEAPTRSAHAPRTAYAHLPDPRRLVTFFRITLRPRLNASTTLFSTLITPIRGSTLSATFALRAHDDTLE
ncbi:hypothetical protein HYPSUDRAFT_214988 [Hypholoma sublateritium FD-334 SS-4]|uniref:Uncharacterized protein n=1 Tax=Hypholoma sublateritium (strain FD-334 SS-4) TaxID=945553 RepID=A0A0D2L8Y7_HYPSF|nr:hypothetical protein HYPSUDRAFT_214988 [Hypholoma sublateritium FD-334 SS-4]